MILNKIVNKTLERVEFLKKDVPIEIIKENINSLYKIRSIDNSKAPYSFEEAIRKGSKNNIALICEVKKASPSKGDIVKEFDYISIGKQYELSGADAISVLTEPYFFKGSNDYLKKIKENTKLPILRKDFIIDEYQIYEAKSIGANAILLIMAILSENQAKEYFKIANELHMSVLFEAHNKEEIDLALNSGARIIGVNNRNLVDFSVDIKNSINLRKYVDEKTLFISESGIKTHENIKELIENKVNGALIGETLMVSKNINTEIRKLKYGKG